MSFNNYPQRTTNNQRGHSNAHAGYNGRGNKFIGGGGPWAGQPITYQEVPRIPFQSFSNRSNGQFHDNPSLRPQHQAKLPGYQQQQMMGGRSFHYSGRIHKNHHQRPFQQHRNNHSNQSSSSRLPPVNHNWEMEMENEPVVAINVVQDYSTTSLVLWVDGFIGEVLCDRNLHHGGLHFFFDGRTELDGSTLAMISQDQSTPFPVKAGSKVEIQVSYMPVDMLDSLTHHMVHITKMSYLTQGSSSEVSIASISHVAASPTEQSLATKMNGDRLMIHPSIFIRDVIKDFIVKGQSQAQLKMADYSHMEEVLTDHRTVVGAVIHAPRWIGDILGMRWNVKRLMLSCEPYGDIQQGYGTIIEVVPNQCVTIRGDDLPSNELVFFPMVALSKEKKERIFSSTRVFFSASPELPGMTYSWRAMMVQTSYEHGEEIPPARARVSTSTLSSGKSKKKKKEKRAAFSVPSEEAESADNAPPTSYVSALAEAFLDLSSPSPFSKSDETFSKQFTKDRANPFLSVIPTPSSSSLSSSSSFSSAEPATVSLIPWTTILGCDPSEPIEKAVERCQIPWPENEYIFGDEPHCHLVVDPSVPRKVEQKRKKERKEKKRERKEREEQCRASMSTSGMSQQAQEALISAESTSDEVPKRKPIEASRSSVFSFTPPTTPESQQLPLPSIPSRPIIRVSVEYKQSLRSDDSDDDVIPSRPLSSSTARPVNPILSAATYANPCDGVRVIGLYDDISVIVERNLCGIPVKKKRNVFDPIANEGEKEEPPMNDGRWFRRRSARLLPTVLVAELVEERNREEDERDIDVHSLKETVVIRNERTLRNSLQNISRPSPHIPVIESPSEKKPVTSSVVDIVTSSPTEEISSSVTNETVPSVHPGETPIMGSSSTVTLTPSPSPPLSNGPATITAISSQPSAPSKLLDMMNNDKIFGAFFGTLLKKNP